eukprot:CAMPEP_0197561444 /NCGR_PEP_ID=MMETSP1320-20131121/25194_1 /TAXON_ID=91990 /ORGANISM="Bolidomonas sp., Strain RCC2347" /LENGTH=150 /DNA_ID=CAMNT_0043123085 /DNA_START=87 /DNA_END=536 /DNA_ORIENTATION=-
MSTLAAATQTPPPPSSTTQNLLTTLSLTLNDLYYHLESTSSPDYLAAVDKAREVLERAGKDFQQLRERVVVQADAANSTKGLSWEVRKDVALTSSVVRTSIERMRRDAEEERKLGLAGAWRKKLEFGGEEQDGRKFFPDEGGNDQKKKKK